MRLIVFTDLDGTLLDHEDYSYDPARRALARLGELQVPLIFVTSKTRAEVEVLQGKMELEEPFIVENGGGIFFPGRYSDLEIPQALASGSHRLLLVGRPYSEVRAFVEGVRERFSIEGFGDMSVERIAELTGLSASDARLAGRREFTEPFRLEDEQQLGELRIEAEANGLKITTGGRFHHLIGAQQDKGRAVELVCGVFRDNWGADLRSIGLGDSPNDLPMLERVDFPVVIPRPAGETLELARPEALTAKHPGSRGWNETVLELLERLYS